MQLGAGKGDSTHPFQLKSTTNGEYKTDNLELNKNDRKPNRLNVKQESSTFLL